jgi:uncharacterized protein YkwD
MQRRLTLLVAAVMLLLALAPAGASAGRDHHRKAHRVGACASSHAAVNRETVRQARLATLCLLNRVRARHGLRPLKLNRKLSRVARRHSRDMVRHSYFAHNSRNGASPFDRIFRSHYVPRNASWYLGENIGYGSVDARPIALVRVWMHSPGHRANILSRHFREIGIGIAVGIPVGGAHASRGGGATYTTDFGYHS